MWGGTRSVYEKPFLFTSSSFLIAEGRVVTSRSTNKFDRGLSRLLHTELHWLDVPERVSIIIIIIIIIIHEFHRDASREQNFRAAESHTS